MKRFMKRVTAIVMTILLALPTGFGFSEEQGMSLSDAIVTSSDAVYTSDDVITADAAINADVGSDSEEEVSSGAIDPVVGEADDVELGGEEDPAPEETAVTTYWFLVNDELYDEQTVGDGEALIQPEDPTAPEGSAFIGWFLEDGTQLFIKDEEISHTDPECPFVNVVARFEDVAEPGDGEAVPGNTPVDTEAGGNTPVDEENNDTPTDVEEKDAPTDADATGETNPDTIEDDAENAADTTTTPEAEDEENATPGDNAASDEDETPAPDEDETPAPDAEQSEDGAENTPKKGETDETDADSDNTDSDETSDGEQGKTGETSDEEKGEEADEQEDGEEIQPVRVTFSTEPEDAAVTVFAVQNNDEGTEEGKEEEVEVEKEAEQGEPEAIEAEEDGTYLLLPGEYVYNATAEGYISVEAVPFTVADEALEINIELEAEEGEKPEEPTPFDQSCTVGSVTITVRADAGAFPAGAELDVGLVNIQARREADEAIDEIRDEDKNVAAAYTYDIKVVDEEGNELQPADGFNAEVSFAMAQAVDGNLEANVYHVTEEAGEMTAEKLETEVSEDTVTAISDGFSIYTVEFTYNDLQYVLQGDGSVALSAILSALGLTGAPTAAEVSDDTLFTAYQADGVWMVTAHRPFSSPEWMKVTLNGVTYDITVTDAQGGLCGKYGDNLTWSLEGTTLVITGTGEMKQYDTDFFKAPWYVHRDYIESLSISSGVTTIGDYAFRDLDNIQSVTIPGSVKTIGRFAFDDCFSLDSVTIPEGETVIDDYAFCSCGNLTSVTIPKSVKTIGQGVFSGCKGLTGVTIPEGVTTIGNYAFYYCDGLTSVTIPKSVTSIGKDAFQDCTSLAHVYYGGTPKQWRALSANANVRAAAEIHYPNACGDDVLWSLSDAGVLTITGTGEMYDYHGEDAPWFASRNSIKTLVIEDGVTSLGEFAFYVCQKLESASIPESVTSIRRNAFFCCTSLGSVTLPKDMTTIGYGAFSNCTSLESMTIPEGVTSIGESVFFSCHSLGSVTIPQSVTGIGANAFSDCNSLNVIYYPGTKAQWSGLNDAINNVLPSGLVGNKAVFVCGVASDPTLGSVTGGGLYKKVDNLQVSLTATPSGDNAFVSWTEDGEQVSADANYSFTASIERSLTANFSAPHKHGDIVFQPRSTLPDTAGNYYLTADVTLTDHWYTPAGETRICLNGHTISTGGYYIRVSSISSDVTLEICDDEGKGSITSTQSYAVAVDNGAFTLRGGTIQKKGSDKFGTGVGVYSGGSFTMTGGAITGFNSVGVIVYNGGTFSVYGAPAVSGNIINDSKKANVYLESGANINIAGALTDSDKKIGVWMQTPGVFTTGWKANMSENADPADYFTSDDPAYVVRLNADGEAKLVEKGWAALQADIDDAGTDEKEFVLSDYADENGKVTAKATDGPLTIAAGQTITLDLNGCTLDRGLAGKDAVENGNVITVNAGAALTVRDKTSTETSPGTGKITGGNDKKNASQEYAGGGVFVDGGALTLLGGAISGNHADNGGGVHVENGGTFTLSGGEIVENTAINGGGVYVYESTFEMSGDARIAQNTAYKSEQSNEWGYGGCAYIYHGNFEITGGTISDNMATEGGGLYITNGGGGTYTHAISNATIENNKAVKYGGGIEVNVGMVTLSDGVSITGNGPQANLTGNKVLEGGGVDISTGCTVEMIGDVVISGNTAAKFGGVCVYFEGASKSRLIVSGAEKVNGGETQIVSPKVTGNKDLSDNNSNVYLYTGTKIEITGALGEAALIGVGMEKPGAFTDGLKGLADDPNGTVKNFPSDDAKLMAAIDGNGEAELVIGWAALQSRINAAAAAADEAARVVTLNEDYTADNDAGDGPLVVPAGNPVTLDLNGHTIDRGLAGKDAVENGNVITVNDGATLTVRDKTSTETSPGTGKITGGNDKKNASQEYAGGGVFVDGGALTLLGGAISGNHAYYGGGVYVKGGALTLLGGAISGNHAYYGGGVCVDGGTLQLLGGTITGNEAAYDGGGVLVDNGRFEMSDGASITRNTAYTTDTGYSTYYGLGGGVYLSWSDFVITGGTISENHAGAGGGLYIFQSGSDESARAISGDAIITGNRADEFGGGIYSVLSTLTLSGDAKVTDNGPWEGVANQPAAIKGGGVYLDISTMEMAGDATISGNEAQDGGGVYLGFKGTLEMTGNATITKNTAETGGGAYIYPSDCCKLEMADSAAITENTAEKGGGAYIDDESIMKMTCSTKITGNTATTGGGAYVNHSGMLDIADSAEITGNAATTGGGVYLYYVDESRMGTLSVSGAAKVNGNTDDTSAKAANNVYLPAGKVIEIAGALDEAALIGVRMEKPGAFTRGLKGLSDDPKGALGNFADDAEVYDIGFDANGEAALMTDWGALQVLIDVAANAADDDPAKTVTLQKDYTANADLGDGALVIPADKSVTLDLNGHTIDRGLAGKDAVENGNVITVNAGAALTVEDKTSTETSPGTGKITGGNDKTTSSHDVGGGVYVDGGALTLLGGAISGNHADHGGGVHVENGGTFTLSGGEIVENTASYGGGVYVTQSTFEMSGDARIAQNTAYKREQSYEWGYGGGAYISHGNFEITGGTIGDNMATEGGGLFIANGGGGTYTHAISNATIENNKAVDCGGGIEVYLGIVTLSDGVRITGNGPQANREGKEVLEGGGVDISTGCTLELVGDVAINGNTALYGGGVCVYYNINAVNNGVLSVSGAEKENDGKTEIVAPKVTGNKDLSDNNSNVYLYTGTKIEITGALGEAALIGVGMEKPGAFTRGLKGLADDPNGAASNFTSDDALLIAAVNDGGEAYLTSGWSWLQGEMRQGHEVTLWQDVVCDDQNKGPLVVPAGVTTAKLDLNGHTVDRGLAGKDAVENGNVITVNAGAALTVKDKTSTETSPGTGKITGGNDKTTSGHDAGGGVYVDGGALTLLGGAISGNHADNGGGVHVENGGTFTLSGGEIVENTANIGGGVYVNEGTFEMSGDARISQNTAYLRDQSNEWGSGGGAYISHSNFEITGGTISDNMATEGGGLYITNGGGGTYTHAISNATIANNKAIAYGGGIEVETGTLTLSGGVEITGNGPWQKDANQAAILEGGGVDVSDGTLEMIGDVVISGNTAAKFGGVCVYSEGASKSRLIVSGAEKVNGGETQIVAPKVTGNKDLSDNNSNVYLCTGTKIEIAGALDEASIGVTTQTAPTQTDPVVITSGLKDKGGAESFTSDDDTYVVARNAAGEVVLGTPVQMPTIDTNTPHGKVELVAISGQTPTGNGIVVCGEILTLKVTAEAGFELKPGTLRAEYTGTNGAPQTDLAEEDPKAPGTWYLTMPGADGVVIKAEFVTPWAALQALIDAAAEKTDPDDRVVTLQKNYRADASLGDTTPLMVAANKEVTLDLNGFTIDRGLAEADAVDGGNVITVNGALTVTDGSKDGTGAITGGNNSGNGGGVYVEAGTFTFSGGAIVGNSAGYGGGVYVCYDSAQDHGTLKVSGKASITDNADLDGNASNVYLPGNAKIDIAGALDEKTAIGVGMEAPGAFTGGLKGKDTNPNGTTGNFPSDDYDYLTVIDDQGEAALISAWRWVQGELAKGGTVTLEKDIRCIDQDDGPLVVPAGVSSGIDLNGHTIDRGLSKANAVADGHVITVKGELTVKDGSGDGKDVITGGNSTGNGGGIRVDGGALEVCFGVTISGNSAANGGGVYVHNGDFKIKDTNIYGNAATCGGGLYIDNDDARAYAHGLENAIIKENKAVEGGGGIYLANGAATLGLLVKITGNEALENGANEKVLAGGGAYVRNGTLEMADDAKITENSAATGGGVYVHFDDQYKGALSVSGLTEVYANVNLDGKASNVYLSDDAVIDIADALEDSAVFGVTTETAPTKGDPVVLTDGLKGKGSIERFASDVDDAGYVVVETAMGEAMLCVPLTVSFDTYQHGEVNLIAISGQEPTGNDIVICNDILTLEVKPAVGWRLVKDGLKAEYEDANGQQAVIATENTDPGEEGTYDVTMPGADVTITAAFELIPAAEPVIDGEPALEGAAALTYGEAGSLSIGAQTGSDQVLSYQWYSCDSEGGDAKAIEGATGAVCDLSARMDAGTYYFLCDVTATRNDNGEKNTKRSGVVKVTVQPKTLEVYAEPRSKIEGEKDPALTYSVYGLVGADRLSGALTRESGELPGTYAITQGTLAASANYVISFTGADFIIGVKPSLNFNGDITQVATATPEDDDKLAYAWTAVPGAEGYDLYFKKCDGKGGYQMIETLDGADLLNSQVTGLKKGKAYKAYIMAWRIENGKKAYIGKASPYIHAIAGGFNRKKKICNAKAVSVKKPEITLAVGKKSKIKASVKPIKRGYNVLRHVSRLRYFSSDRNVAVVNKRGKITAVGVGTCTIYVVANNGVYKEVTVTVGN